MFLFPVVALCVDAPVFAAQSAHHAKVSKLQRERSIEGVHIHIVDEAVVVEFVLHSGAAIPVLVVDV